MSFRFSARSLRNMQGIHPDLRAWLNRLIVRTPIDFAVTEGLRSLERQREKVASKASRTMNSRHLTGHAVDLAAYAAGGISWDAGLYYQIADAGRGVSWEIGVPIRWGGIWKQLNLHPDPIPKLVAEYGAAAHAASRDPFFDFAHFELPATRYPA